MKTGKLLANLEAKLSESQLDKLNLELPPDPSVDYGPY